MEPGSLVNKDIFTLFFFASHIYQGSPRAICNKEKTMDIFVTTPTITNEPCFKRGLNKKGANTLTSVPLLAFLHFLNTKSYLNIILLLAELFWLLNATCLYW
jgi:hypothetical protein